MVAHFSVFITEDFDVTTLTPKIKRAVHNQPVHFAYSIEKAGKLHIHLMLVVDHADDRLNPLTAFFHKVRPAIESLKNVEGCSLLERKMYNYGESQSPKTYTHNLKKWEDFIDAIERYSYIAKTNDKQGIPTNYRKMFGATQVTNKKYFTILESENMTTIKSVAANAPLNFSTIKAINDRYTNCRKSPKANCETKYTFHFLDVKTNAVLGFYGYSLDFEELGSQINAYVSINDLYIKPNTTQEFITPFTDHLEEQLKTHFLALKTTLKDGQTISTMIASTEHDDYLTELLSLTLGSIEDDLNIDLGLGE